MSDRPQSLTPSITARKNMMKTNQTKLTPALEKWQVVIDYLSTRGLNPPLRYEELEEGLVGLVNALLAEMNPQHKQSNNITNTTFETFSKLYKYTYQLLKYREMMGMAHAQQDEFHHNYAKFEQSHRAFFANEMMNPLILHERLIQWHNTYLNETHHSSGTPTIDPNGQKTLLELKGAIEGLSTHSVGLMKPYLLTLVNYALAVSYAKPTGEGSSTDRDNFTLFLSETHLAARIGMKAEIEIANDPKFKKISQALFLGNTPFSRLPVKSFQDIENYVTSLGVLPPAQLTANIDLASPFKVTDNAASSPEEPSTKKLK